MTIFKSAAVKALATGVALAALTLPALAGDAASCKKVRFSDVGWTDVTAVTALAGILTDAVGYESEIKVLAVPVTFTSMKNKDIDVFLGNWMPSMSADAKPFFDDKSVDQLPANLEGAGYGIVVPQYVADMGIKSLKDVGANKDKFEGKIYGIEPGNDGNRIILDFIKKGDIAGFEMVESSEAGMLAQAEKLMKDNKPIVFLGWTPHPVMGGMKLHYLDGMGDSGFGGATVHTTVRGGYMAECPNIGKLVANLKFDLAAENEMMDGMLNKGKDGKTVAMEWLKANPDKAAALVAGVTTFDGGDAAAAVKKALGM
jgi:glycine betaine/proline transport system substrate-binding protein